MSLLVVGASHRSAPLGLLERLSMDEPAAEKLRNTLLQSPHVNEVLTLATCNRVEVYADVDRFHGSVEDISGLLAEHADAGPEELTSSFYVHFDTGAVAHLFAVAAGLESMVVGETQVLGQVREALRRAQEQQSVATSLNALFQQGLRVGKRVHAETGIDRAGQSVVSVALDRVADVLGGLAGLRVCIVGAGAMASLAAASLRRAGVGTVAIASRTRARAARLAERVGGVDADLDSLPSLLADSDALISCTGANGVVIDTETVRRATTGRDARRPLMVVDLALPHDVAPGVEELDGARLVALSDVAVTAHTTDVADEVKAAQEIVDGEVAAFAAARDAARVTPTVVALRSMATDVVSAELERLWSRAGDLTPDQRAEIAQTVNRVADKLLHEPTVRMKRFAGRSPESSYADALAELFALDPSAVAAVTREAP